MSTFVRSLRLALRLLWRDTRSGELTLLGAALVVAVGTVASIGLFVDRLQHAILQEAGQVLAADRVVAAGEPIPEAFAARAEALGLNASRTLTFSSMLFAGDDSQLASVKAVQHNYPLRGDLIVADAPFGAGRKILHGPAPGEAWVDSRLFPALRIKLGDQVVVGVAQLRVARVLIAEPDRGGGFFAFGPRVLINFADVAATQVVQPGSRVGYRLLVAGDEQALAKLQTALAPQLGKQFQWRSARDDSPTIASALDRAESFLLLGGLLAVILSGIAVALTAHRFARRHLDYVAVMKSLGLGPRGIGQLYITMLLTVGVVATLLGCLFGYGIHELVLLAVRQLMPVALPPAGFGAFTIAAGTGMVCLLAFALPPVLRLQQVSPMRVIRGDLAGDGLPVWMSYGAGGLGCLLLLVWYSGSLQLTAWVLSGVAVVVVMLMAIAWVLLRSTRVLGMQAGSAWRLAAAALQRRGWASSVQIIVFGVAIMLLLLLTLLRTSLLDEWRAQLPPDAPNHFLLNVMPEEVATVSAMLRSETGKTNSLAPMIRGRIVGVNSVPIRAWVARQKGTEQGPDPDGERNLTFGADFPVGNVLTAGRWWSPDERGSQVSLDEEYARNAGIRMGDVLTFSIADREVSAVVSSLRKVDWDSLRPNFFIVFSPYALADMPSTFMTAFHLERSRKAFIGRLLTRYPTISVIEVDGLIDQVRSIVDRVALAIELVLALVLVAGGLVLVASVLATIDERVREHALLRALGAPNKLILGALAAEFAVLGALAGLLAAAGSEVSLFVLQREVFQLQASWHPWSFVAGPVIGIVIIGGLGLLATRTVLTTPPLLVLRGD